VAVGRFADTALTTMLQARQRRGPSHNLSQQCLWQVNRDAVPSLIPTRQTFGHFTTHNTALETYYSNATYLQLNDKWNLQIPIHPRNLSPFSQDLSDFVSLLSKLSPNPPPTPRPLVLFISRNRATRRQILNEHQLVKDLSKAFPGPSVCHYPPPTLRILTSPPSPANSSCPNEFSAVV